MNNVCDIVCHEGDIQYVPLLEGIPLDDGFAVTTTSFQQPFTLIVSFFMKTLPICFCPPVYQRTMTTTFNFDKYRSTRTRIAKRSAMTFPMSTSIPSAVRQSISSSLTSTTDGPSGADDSENSRDWSRLFRHVPRAQRVIFVGHNPSEESWKTHIPYAHRTNRFWKLLESSKIITSASQMNTHAQLPHTLGIGFIDLFVTCGSDAAQVNIEFDRSEFLIRLGPNEPEILAIVSKVVAEKFLGAKEYRRYCRKDANKGYGFVGTGDAWGFVNNLKQCQLWVLPSTSGRASMSWEYRLGPFVSLQEQLESMDEWNQVMVEEKEGGEQVSLE